MFIASFHDRFKDQILVWEKTESGKRIKREYSCPYNFYVPAKDGKFTAITGEQLKFLEFNSKNEFNQACLSYPTKFESDLQPLDKVMMTYFGKGTPVLSVGFLDIEVDYDPAVGFPRPSNPYAPINAITLFRSDIQSHFTLALPPKTWGPGPHVLPEDMQNDNYFLFRSEREMLEQFIELIDDVDVISGWNSEFFDLPYIGKRIELLFGQQALRRLGFEGGPAPRWGEQERFKGAKEKEIILNLQSRVHLDYMLLFKKFTLGGRQSYSLGAITAEELDVPKLHYEGTLRDLYNGEHRPNLSALKPEAEQDELYKVNVEREKIRRELEKRGLSVT